MIMFNEEYGKFTEKKDFCCECPKPKPPKPPKKEEFIVKATACVKIDECPKDRKWEDSKKDEKDGFGLYSEIMNALAKGQGFEFHDGKEEHEEKDCDKKKEKHEQKILKVCITAKVEVEEVKCKKEERYDD